MPREPGRNEIVPAFWREFYEATGVPAAVRAGIHLYVTGHTGTLEAGGFPDSVEEQIRQAFRNVTVTLTEAGANWGDVVEMTTYLVGLSEHSEPMLAVAAEFFTEHVPAWTAVGVSELFEPEAVFEVRCVALLAG